MKLVIIRRNRSRSAIDSAYKFPCSVRCLSVTSVSLCLNHLRVYLCGPVTHCVRWDTWPLRRKDLGLNPQPERAIANYSQAVRFLLPTCKYKRRVGWTCRSDFGFCRINMVFVVISIITFVYWRHKNDKNVNATNRQVDQIVEFDVELCMNIFIMSLYSI